MSDQQDERKIVVDEDWKSRVRAEREAAKKAASAASEDAQGASEAAGGPAGGTAGETAAGRIPPASFDELISTFAVPALTAKASTEAPAGEPMASMDEFLDRVRTYGFTITAMAFQDVWTLDLERLRSCCLHVVKPGGKIVPFCAYNLTDSGGHPIHRGTE